MQYINLLLNNAFSLSILLVIVGSLVGLYVGSRARDRCLRDFEDYRVTLERDGGKPVWGKLRVYSSGLELEYEQSHRDLEGHIENSYVLYSAEINNLRTLYRYHDELTEEEMSRRKGDIRKVYKPTAASIVTRKLRNFTNTFKDAILQSFNIFMGQRGKGSTLMAKKSEISGISGQLLSASAGNSFDPILERYVGQYVVVEQTLEGVVEEIPGILKEYSDKFIELLNVEVDFSLRTDLHGRERLPNHPVEVIEEGDRVRVFNRGTQTIQTVSLKDENLDKKLDLNIEPGRSIEFDLGESGVTADAELVLNLQRKADLVLPRSSSVLRHGGKPIRHTLETLLGLDSLLSRTGVAKLKKALVLTGRGEDNDR